MPQPDPNLELATQISKRFIERRDAMAVQTNTGAYMPVREDMKDTSSPLVPWRGRYIVEHLEGKRTLGHYVVSPEGKCRVIVFDIDLRAKAKPDEEPITFNGAEIDPREVWQAGDSPAKRDLALQLRVIAEGLAKRTKKLLDLPVMVAYSGSKGMHVYGCLDPQTPAADAREAIHTVIDSFDGLIVPDKGNNFFKHADKFAALSIEVFPKQDEVTSGGFGNLVRLPLGVNRKTGGKGFFLDMSTPQDQFKRDDADLALSAGSLRD